MHKSLINKCITLEQDVSLPAYLTVDELAHRWRISRQMIYKMRRDGQLGTTYFGRAVRIAAAEVARIEAAFKPESTDQLRQSWLQASNQWPPVGWSVEIVVK